MAAVGRIARAHGLRAKAVSLEEVPLDRAAPLVCGRLSAVMTLQARLRADLERDGLLPLLTDLELPILRADEAMDRPRPDGTLDGLGPIGGLDHSPEEYLEVDSIVPRTTLLAGLLLAVARDTTIAARRSRER